MTRKEALEVMSHCQWYQPYIVWEAWFTLNPHLRPKLAA